MTTDNSNLRNKTRKRIKHFLCKEPKNINKCDLNNCFCKKGKGCKCGYIENKDFDFDKTITRESVLKKNKKCYLCKNELYFKTNREAKAAVEIDHKTPISECPYHAHNWNNVGLICKGCNSEKSNKTLKEQDEDEALKKCKSGDCSDCCNII